MSMPSLWEWGVIVLLVVLIFGAKRLPELGSSLGKGIRNFKKTVSGESDKEIENKKS
ncbi:MAG: twin-arginine translocase TatA/TatE family subunit [Deltaproteobacteria bacterium]|nr:twin-arginine translocase TatA/TatE family subunit [Deltaproteobacteria bacterium]